MYEDILSPWKGECDSDQVSLVVCLVVITLSWIARDQGSIPVKAQNF